jgi:serine/threonine protein kinase
MTPEQIGPYVILDKLGAGGMGTVYLGRHKDNGQVAAVKMMPATHAEEEGFVERFNREIDAMRKLNNPHTVRLFDSGADHGTYYYAMEYVPGETIMQMLRREKRIDWEQAVEFAIQICQALKAAHDAGIIHRDLKPSNLLVTPEGQIKLTDFGVAQVFAASRLTLTGGIIGTAEFMSPEQASGKRVTRQSDLYSLGAVLYCMVTGRPPFSGNAAVDVIHKQRFGMFDKPRMIVPEIPLWLEEIICQLLEKEPEKRFPDAHVLMRQLQGLLDRYREPITSNVTLDEDVTVDASMPTVLSTATFVDSNGRRTGPGAATLMREGIRAHLEETPSPIGALLNNTWVLLALLVLLISGVAWMMTRPPSASSTVTEEAEEVDTPLAKLQLSLRLRKDLVPADDVRRQMLRIQSALERGDREQARHIASSLLVLLAEDPQWKKERETARKIVERLGDPPGPEHYGAAVAALKRAEADREAGRIDAARDTWQAIVDLYGSDRNAAEYVAQARKGLQETRTAEQP